MNQTCGTHAPRHRLHDDRRGSGGGDPGGGRTGTSAGAGVPELAVDRERHCEVVAGELRQNERTQMNTLTGDGQWKRAEATNAMLLSA